MTTYVALLRGINVGGANKLAMQDLVALCEKLGFQQVRTYIQSGNVVFQSAAGEDEVRSNLEQALARKMAKPIAVMVRTTAEVRRVLAANPFVKEDPAKVMVMFGDGQLETSALEQVKGRNGEQLRMGKRELYVYYPDGMGRSKLQLPKTIGPTTARNVNTVTKLVEMTG